MLDSLKIQDVLDIVSGELINITQAAEEILQTSYISSVSTDTRSIKPGALYIPLKGKNFNGHDFISDAIKSGASAVLSDEIPGSIMCTQSVPVIKVESCLQALGEISAHLRRGFNGPVIAVTGSAGKTSIKQLLSHVLDLSYSVWMTQGNLNNHIGVPLTLLQIEPENNAAVVELGASAEGEIACTAQWVKPDIGIITNASEAHLDGFGDLQTIVRTKGELIDHVKPEGIVVLNRDDQSYSEWKIRAGSKKVVSFGLHEESDVRAEDICSNLNGSQFLLIAEHQQLPIQLPLLGEHNVCNALAVAAVACSLGMDLHAIKSGLETAEAYSGRLQWCKGSKGQKIINDTYNASPASVYAAIDVLAQADNSWLVLGDMAELGDQSDDFHHQIGRYAQEKGIKHLYAAGVYSKSTVSAFGNEAIWFENNKMLIDEIINKTDRNDVVLVKGSRSSNMNDVVSAICPDEKEISL